MKSFDGKLYWQLMSKNILQTDWFSKNILLLESWEIGEDGRRIGRGNRLRCVGKEET